MMKTLGLRSALREVESNELPPFDLLAVSFDLCSSNLVIIITKDQLFVRKFSTNRSPSNRPKLTDVPFSLSDFRLQVVYPTVKLNCDWLTKFGHRVLLTRGNLPK